ncbi:ABC transporter ATP-binding protein [Exiguobacterium qingdaonense]|uniref:ABC transporter ATP-binding protein n=1 Tax=Exiguobacterium qingdaonense TaxID=2751251 RepID=UPI001BE68EEA|nr:ABC transporter ATP-binding protein [Exiguobacterium qingdaonense]
MINCLEVGKKYGDTWSLHPVSEEVAPGRIIALCGSNGAGKSTLLNLMNGTIEPSTGSIRLNGYTPKQRLKYNDCFGYMPDDFSFDDGWTVEETFVYYATLQGASPNAEMLKRVDLYEHRKKRVAQLSKGMRQRLLLSQALVSEPDVLLLDEPTNGLDPVWIRMLQDLLREEAKRGATIVFSTHQLDVASMLSDEVWMMRAGVMNGKVYVQEEQAAYERLREFFFESRDDTCQMDVARTK